MTIYAIKAPDEPSNIEKVFKSPIWPIETADLYNLRQSGWDSLTGEEQECYHDFLLNFKNGDYVIYINVPEWGRCTLAEVKGEYRFHYDDKDFNHRFPVDPKSVRSFDRNDAMVSACIECSPQTTGPLVDHLYRKCIQRAIGSIAAWYRTQAKHPGNQSTLSGKRNQTGEITQKIHSTHPNTANTSLQMFSQKCRVLKK